MSSVSWNSSQITRRQRDASRSLIGPGVESPGLEGYRLDDPRQVPIRERLKRCRCWPGSLRVGEPYLEVWIQNREPFELRTQRTDPSLEAGGEINSTSSAPSRIGKV